MVKAGEIVAAHDPNEATVGKAHCQLLNRIGGIARAECRFNAGDDKPRMPGNARCRSHALGQRRCRVANVDLATGDIEWPAVECRLLGQPGHGVLGGGVGDRQRSRGMRGD